MRPCRLPPFAPRLFVAAGILATVPMARAQSLSLGQEAKLSGVITARAGDSMTVKTDTGNAVARLTRTPT